MNLISFKDSAKELDNLTYTYYYLDLKLLALSLFKWENLPNNMDEKWIETFLFEDGECMFFEDETLGLMVSKVTKIGLNHMNEPIDLTPVSINGVVKSKPYKNGKDAVLIRNNDLGVPNEIPVRLFAMRLTDITRTQDVNINAQKTPVLILCSDKQRLTMKNVYNQFKGNEPVIYGVKDGITEGISVLKTDAPIVFDKLQLQKHQVKNEFLTYLGINNANQDKRERLVADEVEANNDEVLFAFNKMLKARERACKEINRIFKLNIKVSRRVELPIMNDSEGFEEDPNDSEVA